MAPFFVEEQTQRPDHTLHRELTRSERLQQLERIVSSNHFRNSKRYPSFLRHVVEHTVDEDSEVLKERNLGVEIFGRTSDYDTNADPIVRVTAGEVRKRLAQYYQTPGHENELRIDLPLGSYVPHFYPASHAPVTSEQPVLIDHPAVEEPLPELDTVPVGHAQLVPRPGRWQRIKGRPILTGLFSLFILAIVIMASLVLAAFMRERSLEAGIRYFWQPFTSASKNALIVIGVHYFDDNGRPVSTESHLRIAPDARQSALSTMEDSDMLPLSDIVSYSKITDLLTRGKLEYRTQGSASTTLEDLRAGPVILIGGFNNVWTMRLTSALRYRFVPKGAYLNGIEDSEDASKLWLFDNLQPALSNSRDFAIVASYYDNTIEQHVVIAAGIGKNGTVAAAEFLTTDKYLQSWLEEAKIPKNKNIELVLSTEVLDGEPGPPHVIAYTAW